MKNRGELRVLISRNGKTRCWKSLIAASVTVIAYLVHTKHPDYFPMSFKGSLGARKRLQHRKGITNTRPKAIVQFIVKLFRVLRILQ